MMSLEEQIKQTLDDFQNTPSKNILDILNQIKPYFQNDIISEYLQGKIQKVNDANNEGEKKNQCKELTPYLNWYLQGL